MEAQIHSERSRERKITLTHLRLGTDGFEKEQLACLACAHTTLLDLLREKFNYTGAKEACGVGECGACTVILDGKAVRACLILAFEVDGSEIMTIESLSTGINLHPLRTKLYRSRCRTMWLLHSRFHYGGLQSLPAPTTTYARGNTGSHGWPFMPLHRLSIYLSGHCSNSAGAEMKLKHLLAPVLTVLAPPLGLSYLHLLRTCRYTIVAPPEIASKKAIFDWPHGVIYCSWHSRLFYWGEFGKRRGVTALISASKDGEIIRRNHA